MEPSRETVMESIWRSLTTWNPQPLTPPQFDHRLEDMSPLRRVAVILHFRLASLEYAISSSGTLRAFVKLCIHLGLILTLPAILIVPALVGLFYGLADITAAIAQACVNILHALLAVVGIVIVVWMLVAATSRRR